MAAVIGNTLERYDFVVYAFLAGTIAKLLFPVGNETASLLPTLATFGVGFVVRPVGAILLGSPADRAGRKPALMLDHPADGVGHGNGRFRTDLWIDPLGGAGPDRDGAIVRSTGMPLAYGAVTEFGGPIHRNLTERGDRQRLGAGVRRRPAAVVSLIELLL